MKCLVPGCQNDVARVYVGVRGPVAGTCFGICAFHGDAIIRHGTKEQVHDYVFGGGEAAKAGETR